MLRDAVRGVVVVASELAEEAGKRVLGAAEGLLQRGGVDVAGLERRLGGQFPPSAESLRTMAGEAVTAGRAGVDLVAGVARSEVERVFEKVGDQVVKVGVVLGYLESKLREVEEEEPAVVRPAAKPGAARKPAGRADGLFGAGWDGAPAAAEPATESAPAAQPVRKPAARRGAKAPADGATAGKAGAEKAGARKAPAKKAPARKAAAGKAPAEKTVVKKTVAKKTVTRKAATSGTATVATTRKGAAKKTVVRKSVAKKAAPEKGVDSDG